jgi:hypothetical protein
MQLGRDEDEGNTKSAHPPATKVSAAHSGIFQNDIWILQISFWIIGDM